MPFGNIGRTLEMLRRERRLSQAELAERVGVGPAQVSRYETGKTSMTLDPLEKLLAELEVTPVEFFQLAAASLDPSSPHRQRQASAIDDRLRSGAFRALHATLDELQLLVERALDPAVLVASTGGAAAASAPAHGAKAAASAGSMDDAR
jgi:transcriptional regulator with XRE-family HTH domain